MCSLCELTGTCYRLRWAIFLLLLVLCVMDRVPIPHGFLLEISGERLYEEYTAIVSQADCLINLDARTEPVKSRLFEKICEIAGYPPDIIDMDKTMAPIVARVNRIRKLKRGKRKLLEARESVFRWYLYLNATGETLDYLKARVTNQDAVIARRNLSLQRASVIRSELETQNERLRRRVVLAEINRDDASRSSRGLGVKHALGQSSYSQSQQRRHKQAFFSKMSDLVKLCNFPGMTVSGLTAKDRTGTERLYRRDIESGLFSPRGSAVASHAEDNECAELNFLEVMVFLKDRHLISDEAYHEMAQRFKELPRLYKLKDRIKELNSEYDISCVNDENGVNVGVRQSFRAVLSARIRAMLANSDPANTVTSLTIKLSGDGTKIGKRIHVVNTGFCIVGHETAGETSILLVVKTDEKYQNIAESLRETLEEIRPVAMDGFFDYDNGDDTSIRFKVEFVLGGDLKYLNVVMGISAVTSTFFCIHCKCPKDERHDMSKRWSVVDPNAGARTISEMQGLCELRRGNRYNCIHPPIFDFVPVSSVVTDILHAGLRIFDALLQGFMKELQVLDHCNGFKWSDEGSVMRKFQRHVRGLGIFYELYEGPGGIIEGTNMPCHACMKILKFVDPVDFLAADSDPCEVRFLWREFVALYDRFRNFDPDTDSTVALSKNAKEWVGRFARKYQANRVTPYMHQLAFHMPELVELHGSLGKWSQERFEYMNHVETRDFFQGSNHRHQDGSAFISYLQRQNRQSDMVGLQRTKRTYGCGTCGEPGHRGGMQCSFHEVRHFSPFMYSFSNNFRK